jgi:hypothetical protein
MIEKSRFLAEQAAGLPPTDRVDLEEDILAMLPEDAPDWGATWAEDRLAAYDPGEIEAFDFDEVIMVQLGIKFGRA